MATKWRPVFMQFPPDTATDTPETANDEMLPQLLNAFFHPSSPQGIIKVLLEEEH
jgi:hypothetical protein